VNAIGWTADKKDEKKRRGLDSAIGSGLRDKRESASKESGVTRIRGKGGPSRRKSKGTRRVISTIKGGE